MYTYIKPVLMALFFISCNTGKLEVIVDIPSSLKETSAIEKTTNSNVLWVIQDAGNTNHLYGLNLKGDIVKDIKIDNAENIDWEDLASDSKGNIFIGDFGNNHEKQNNSLFTKFQMPKMQNPQLKQALLTLRFQKDMDSARF